ncbi:hypothetical protein D3C72_1894490 [compost metagenome]
MVARRQTHHVLSFQLADPLPLSQEGEATGSRHEPGGAECEEILSSSRQYLRSAADKPKPNAALGSLFSGFGDSRYIPLRSIVSDSAELN